MHRVSTFILTKGNNFPKMFHMKQRDEILLHVFAAFGCAANLARFLGVSRAAVCHWKRVPFKHLQVIEKQTGITRETMRPDIYGPKKIQS